MAEEPQGGIVTETQDTWYSDDYKDLVTQQHWKEPNDVVRDYQQLQKSASQKVKVPAEGATEEEIAKFWTANGKVLGVPESPDKYVLEKPELPEGMPYDDNFEKAVRDAAHKARIPQSHLKPLYDVYNSFQTEQYNNYVKETNELREKQDNALKDEWKSDYDSNTEIARRAYKAFGGEEFSKLLLDSNYDNHPLFKKVFYSVGMKMKSDSLIKGDTEGKDKEYVPRYKSPEMYAQGDDEESRMARAYYEARGHKY